MVHGSWRVAIALIVLHGPVAVDGAEQTQPAGADPAQEFYGPLRARDLTPFGFLRLDMRPAFTGTLAPGEWAVEADFAFQNTWAMSDAVEHYLSSRGSRSDLTASDVAAIQALPGENFLVDLEMAELGITVHRQIGPHLGAFAILSGAFYGGGVLDGTVEQFHTAFGMSGFGRPQVSRDQVNIVFDLDAIRYDQLDAGSRSGVLDPVFGLRYTGVVLPAPWALALEAAVKVPVDGERAWLSTGRTDAGVQASFARRGERHAFFATLAVVAYAGSDSPVQPDARVLPTLVLGLDSHLTARTHSIVQVYASPSVYDRDETRLDELLANKYQLSLGLRHRRGGHLWTFALTENLGNFNNTPDVGMQIGWAYRPGH